VISVAPAVGGDLGEISMDVVGLGEVAALGLRLHIFGDSADMDGEGFALSNVESTILCGRGVGGGCACEVAGPASGGRLRTPR